MSNVSLTVSKRIVGGSVLQAGVFPWIVYVTLVYRKNSNSPLNMVKNCSGTLLNEIYVLTAAHCLNTDSSLSFNSEFTNIESMVRIYFGFVDKSKVFASSASISNHERRVQKVIFHPKYQQATLKNDLVILKLDKPIYRDSNVDYLCLFNYDKQDNLVNII
jgi:secreted trypsin-like serine protease